MPIDDMMALLQKVQTLKDEKRNFEAFTFKEVIALGKLRQRGLIEIIRPIRYIYLTQPGEIVLREGGI